MKIEPERMLTTLAGDLAIFGGRLETIERQQLAAHLRELQETVGSLFDIVATLQPGEEEEADPGPMVALNWADLDQRQAADAWELLVTWCREVYRPMYAPTVWRPCWYRHPLLRLQLDWLRANWEWSYAPGCPPTRPAEWHTRWWPAVRDFMGGELERCGKPGQQLVEPRHAVPEDIDETGFEDGGLSAYIERDIARRPEPPEDDD